MGQIDDKNYLIEEDGTIIRNTKSSKIDEMKKKISSSSNDDNDEEKPKENKGKGGKNNIKWIILLLVGFIIGAIIMYIYNRTNDSTNNVTNVIGPTNNDAEDKNLSDAKKGDAEVQKKLEERKDSSIIYSSEAERMYLSDAEKGDAWAQYNLGNCYYLGDKGVPQNEQEAIKWYSKAANNGHAQAQYILGECYEKGQGLDKNIIKAKEWYKKAAEQGNVTALENIKRLEKDSLSIITKKEISNTVSSPTGYDNGHGYVDLGLSIKWATCNIGATKVEEFGGEYAWGETTTKTSYTWKNYKFRVSGNDFENIKFSKYNTKSKNGTVDNKQKLDLSDDVAHMAWGGKWRMPTKVEYEELIRDCTWSKITLNGIKGWKVTSKKAGYTDKSIFFPYNDNGDTYWSSSLNIYTPSMAFYMYVDNYRSSLATMSRQYERYVRPVCK